MAGERERPVSVAIIAWIFIVIGIMNVLLAPLTIGMPQMRELLEETGMSPALAFVGELVGGIIGMVSGIAMLKARNWGRVLYLVYFPVVMAVSLFLSGFQPSYVVAGVFYVVIFVFLTRPAAAKYFKGPGSEAPRGT